MLRTKPPWPLWGCLGTAEAGGFRRQSLRNFLPIPSSLFPKKPSPFHMGSYFGKVPPVNPSVTPPACQLPLAREPFFARYRSIVRYRAFSCFQSTAWDRNPNKIYIPKRGQGLKLRTRAKAKGQSPDGSTRGILKGGAIRAGASCSPLEPASLHTFLPEQESMAAGRQDKPI